MSLAQFKLSARGRLLAPLLGSEEAIRQMESKSREDRPAVEAIGREVEARVGTLDDEDRKMVGRWVKEVLVRRGWQPDRKGRVAAGHFFARGTIYRRAGPRLTPAGGAARLDAARVMLAELPGRPQSADELVAERRHAFGRGE